MPRTKQESGASVDAIGFLRTLKPEDLDARIGELKQEMKMLATIRRAITAGSGARRGRRGRKAVAE